mmetsp:Transcript_4268/g.11331  ORF Transcript_4268/g.11331 Transcript_4268/m.11331 type:complete len:267 (+) Transcript_4268:291-1091(+)
MRMPPMPYKLEVSATPPLFPTHPPPMPPLPMVPWSIAIDALSEGSMPTAMCAALACVAASFARDEPSERDMASTGRLNPLSCELSTGMAPIWYWCKRGCGCCCCASAMPIPPGIGGVCCACAPHIPAPHMPGPAPKPGLAPITAPPHTPGGMACPWPEGIGTVPTRLTAWMSASSLELRCANCHVKLPCSMLICCMSAGMSYCGGHCLFGGIPLCHPCCAVTSCSLLPCVPERGMLTRRSRRPSMKLSWKYSRRPDATCSSLRLKP